MDTFNFFLWNWYSHVKFNFCMLLEQSRNFKWMVWADALNLNTVLESFDNSFIQVIKILSICTELCREEQFCAGIGI